VEQPGCRYGQGYACKSGTYFKGLKYFSPTGKEEDYKSCGKCGELAVEDGVLRLNLTSTFTLFKYPTDTQLSAKDFQDVADRVVEYENQKKADTSQGSDDSNQNADNDVDKKGTSTLAVSGASELRCRDCGLVSRLELIFDFEAGISLSPKKLDVRFKGDANFTVALELLLSLRAVYELEKPIPGIDALLKKLSIGMSSGLGPLAAFIRPELGMNFHLTLSAEAIVSIAVGMRLNLNMELGFTQVDGVFENVAKVKSDLQRLGPVFTGQATVAAKLALVPKFGLRLFTVILAELSLEPYLTARVEAGGQLEYTSDALWRGEGYIAFGIYYGMDASLAVSFDSFIWTKKLHSSSWSVIKEREVMTPHCFSAFWEQPTTTTTGSTTHTMPCGDDPNEPNDLIDQATVSEPNNGGINGIMCGDEQDYFVLTLCPFGKLYLSLRCSMDDCDGDIDLYLVDEYQNQVAFSANSGVVEAIEYQNDQGQNKTFHLLLSPFGDAADLTVIQYELYFNVESCGLAPCVPDVYEPNDVAYEATWLLQGGYDNDMASLKNATLCGYEDYDYFAIDVCEKGHLNIRIESFGLRYGYLNDLQLSIVNASGDVLSLAVREGREYNKIAQIIVREQATLYAAIMLSGPATDHVLYNITADVTGCAVWACTIGNEPNNNPHTATVLLEDGRESHAYASKTGRICGTESDYFAVEVCAKGRLRVTLELNNATSDLDLYLTTTQDDVVDLSESTGAQETVVFNNTANVTETLYVIVVPFDFGPRETGNYTIIAESFDCGAVTTTSTSTTTTTSTTTLRTTSTTEPSVTTTKPASLAASTTEPSASTTKTASVAASTTEPSASTTKAMSTESSAATTAPITTIATTTTATTTNACHNQPCGPGTCTSVDAPDTFICTCDKGFAGQRCQVTVLDVELRFPLDSAVVLQDGGIAFRAALLEALKSRSIPQSAVYSIDLRSGSLIVTLTLRETDARILVASSEPLTVMGTQADTSRLLGAEGTQEDDENSSAATVAAIAGAVAGACVLALVVLLLVRQCVRRTGAGAAGALCPDQPLRKPPLRPGADCSLDQPARELPERFHRSKAGRVRLPADLARAGVDDDARGG
jgi:hypothetical protein